MALTRRAVLSMVGGGAIGFRLGADPLVRPLPDAVPALAASPGEWPLTFTAGAFTQGGWARGMAPTGTELRLAGQSVRIDPDGAFLIAFDRDAPGELLLELVVTGQAPAQRMLTIAPRAWLIEQVDAPLRPPGVPDAEFQRRRAAELARIAAARAVVTGAQGWRQTMVRPAPGRISGRFGAQRVYRGQPGAYHSGLDLAATTGTPILAPADGVVVLAATEPFTLEGLLLLVDHGMGLTSAFLHCSEHLVAVGDTVRQSQPIASVGNTGRATGPHLHWGLRWQAARLDPLLLLGGQGAVFGLR